MLIRGLEVTSFRCYEKGLWHFGEGGALLVGPNGAGKTTILEALSKIALLRGFGSDAEMIYWGKSGYRLRGLLAEGVVEIRYEKGQGTEVFFQGEVIRPLRLWVGRLPLITFRPGDTEWIEGPAAIRRRWADRLLVQLFPDYLEALLTYERALAQRNALLATEPPPTLEALQLWERPLLEAGLLIQEKRLWLVQTLKPLLQTTHTIENLPVEIDLRYKASTATPSREAWETKWHQLRKEELRRRRTLIGPHTEDFQVLFAGRPARGYTSEGQKKWLLIALRWAEVRLFNQLLHRKPLLLLDDLGEKLDSLHLAALGRLSTEAAQVFVTDVEERRGKDLFPALEVIRISA